MKKFLCSLLCLAAALTAGFAQTAGQVSVVEYGANGLKYRWVTPQNGKVLGWQGGQLVMTDAGGGTVDFADIENTPTTLSGYGITDALTAAAASTTYLTQANAGTTYALLSHTHTIANVTGLQTALDAKAPLASPTFTGTVTIPSGSSIAGYLTSATASTTYAPLASPTFTGTVTIPSGSSIAGYLTSATASTTYAPLASPTFTGTVTIPSGASISGYLTTATAASTYLPLAGGTVTGITTFSNATASTSTGTGAVVLSAGGLGVSGAIQAGGNVVSSGNIFAGTGNTIGFSSRVRMSSSADGLLAMTNVSATTLQLQLGGTSNSFPEFITRTTNGITLQSAAATSTFNDSASSSGTVALRYLFGLPTATLTSNNTGITVTRAAGLYLAGAPANGTNTTISNSYTLLADAGTSLIRGTLQTQMGTGNGVAAVGGAYTSVVNDVSEPDGDVETDLHSVTLPANSFTRNGDTAVFNIDYSLGNFSDGCTMRLKVGANTILTVSGDSSTAGSGSLRLELTRTDTGTLRWRLIHELQPDGVTLINSRSDLSITFSNALSVVSTGQSGPGGIVHVSKTLVDWRPAY